MATTKDGTPTPAAPKADANVKDLQLALAAYAAAVGYPAANPGVDSGIVDIPTTMAVVATIPRIPGIPDEVALLAYTVGPLMLSEEGRARVFALIKDHAQLITGAITAIQVLNPPPVPAPPAPAPPPSVKPDHALVPAFSSNAATVWLPPPTPPPPPTISKNVKIAGAIGLGLVVAGSVILIRRQRRRAQADG